MKATLLHKMQYEILEKIAIGESAKEIQTFYRNGPITMEKEGAYVIEAFAMVIETLLLSEKVGLVLPMKNNVVQIPAEWPLLNSLSDIIEYHYPDPKMDQGTFDIRMFEFMSSEDPDDLLTWMRAYNGQFGDVNVRLTYTDFATLAFSINTYHEANNLDGRIGEDDDELCSDAIMRATMKLNKEYRKLLNKDLGNNTPLVTAPLVSVFIDRLSKKPKPEEITEKLLNMRQELRGVREKYAIVNSAFIKDSATIEERIKATRAIETDAKTLARKWDKNYTDNPFVKYCLTTPVFLVKCLIGKADIEEAIDLALEIAPVLERYFRSSSPTIMAKLALKSKKMINLQSAFESKFKLKFRF